MEWSSDGARAPRAARRALASRCRADDGGGGGCGADDAPPRCVGTKEWAGTRLPYEFTVDDELKVRVID